MNEGRILPSQAAPDTTRCVGLPRDVLADVLRRAVAGHDGDDPDAMVTTYVHLRQTCREWRQAVSPAMLAPALPPAERARLATASPEAVLQAVVQQRARVKKLRGTWERSDLRHTGNACSQVRFSPDANLLVALTAGCLPRVWQRRGHTYDFMGLLPTVGEALFNDSWEAASCSATSLMIAGNCEQRLSIFALPLAPNNRAPDYCTKMRNVRMLYSQTDVAVTGRHLASGHVVAVDASRLTVVRIDDGSARRVAGHYQFAATGSGMEPHCFTPCLAITAASACGPLLAVGHVEGIFLWHEADLTDFAEVRPPLLRFDSWATGALDLAQDGRFLAAVDEAGAAHLFDIPPAGQAPLSAARHTWSLPAAAPNRRGRYREVVLEPYGGFLLLTSAIREISVWRHLEGVPQRLASVPGWGAHVTCSGRYVLAMKPDGECYGKTAALWRIHAQEIAHVRDFRTSQPSSAIILAPDGETLIWFEPTCSGLGMTRYVHAEPQTQLPPPGFPCSPGNLPWGMAPRIPLLLHRHVAQSLRSLGHNP